MSDDLLNQSQPPVVEQQEMVAQETVAPQEKMLPQSEVNDLAGKIRAEAYEKGRQQAMQAQMQAAPAQENFAAQQVAQGSMSEDQVKAMIQEQTLEFQQKQAQRMMAEKIVGEFSTKMQGGAEKYEDFEATVKELDLRTIPEIVQLANSVSNTDDVMYDLGKNPYKIANLKVLAQTSPHLARAEMNRLSQSIVSNGKAKDQVAGVKEPLSQMKPSTGTVDTGEMSVSDFRNASWLRR